MVALVWTVSALVLLGSGTGAGIVAAPDVPNPTPSALATGPAPPGPRLGTHPSVPGEILGPFHGRYFNVSTGAPVGVVGASQSVAIDPVSQTVFEADYLAGAISAFNATTGASVAFVPVGPGLLQGYCVCSVALDTLHHNLFVAVDGGSRPGWVEVLNESTFAQVGNITVSGFPAAPFAPMLEVFDPVSDQVFVENQTGGFVVAINASSMAVRALLPCLIPRCATGGLVLVPGYSELIIPTVNNSLQVYNSSTDVAMPPLVGPSGTTTVFGAYDTIDHRLYVGNESVHPTAFLRFDLTTGTYSGATSGCPAALTGLAYSRVGNVLVAIDAAYRQQVIAFNATGGSPIGLYNASIGSATYRALALDGPLNEIVTAGNSNNSSVAFQLPGLAPAVHFASFGSFQTTTTVDATTGTFYVATRNPDSVQAYSESNGSRLWVLYHHNSFGAPVALAIDPAVDTLFLGEPFALAIGLFNATTHLAAGVLHLTGVPVAIGLDGTNHLLYVAEDGQVQVFSTLTRSSIGTVATPGLFPCWVVADPAQIEAFVGTCSSPSSNATIVRGLALSLGKSFGVGVNALGGAITTNGDLLVANSGGTNLTEINPGAATLVGSVSLGKFQPSAVVVDTTDSLLFVPSLFNRTVEILDAASNALVGTIPVPSGGIESAAFDNVSGNLFAPLYVGAGSVLVDTIHPPSAPGSLVATSSNSTVALTWSAPSSGGAAVLSYNVSLGTGPSGPWIANQTVGTPSATFAGLSDGTPYFLGVTARNLAGTGPRSLPANATPLGVPFPPTSVTLSGATNTSLNVSWAAPATSQGTPVTDYTLRYRIVGSGVWSSLDAQTNLTARLLSLQPATNYTVFVVAVNQVGSSNPSSQVTAATLASPPPQKPTVHTHPTIAWTWIAVLIAVIAVALLGTLFVFRRLRAPAGRVPEPSPPPAWNPPPAWSEDEFPSAPPTNPPASRPPGGA